DAQPLYCRTVDRGSGQERNGLAARSLCLLPQRPQIADSGFSNVSDLGLLVCRGVELNRHVFGHALDAIVDLRWCERIAEHTAIAHSEVTPGETLAKSRG